MIIRVKYAISQHNEDTSTGAQCNWVRDLAWDAMGQGSEETTVQDIGSVDHFADFWIQKSHHFNDFWIQKSLHFYDFWIQKYNLSIF